MNIQQLSIAVSLSLVTFLAAEPASVRESFSGYQSPLAVQGDAKHGWSSPWAADVKWGGLNGQESTALVEPTNLPIPKGYQLSEEARSRPGHIAELGNGLARILAEDQRIDLSQDATHYISCLWMQSGSGKFGTMQIGLLAEKTHSRKPFLFTTQSSKLQLGTNNNEQIDAKQDFHAGAVYLLVIKLVSYADSSKADQVFASIWTCEQDSVEGEPKAWQMSAELAGEDRDRLLDRIMIKGSENNRQCLDELRIGSSFAAVIGR